MKLHTFKKALAISAGLLGLSAMSSNAALVTFDGAAGTNLQLIGAYQPLLVSDGLTMTFTNVGVYNGGPDHTTGVTGGTNWNTFQQDGGAVAQTIGFDATVQLSSMWLTNFSAGSFEITITADLAAGGTFTDTFTPTAHTGNGNYVWTEYTGLAGVDITSFSLDSANNVQLDDLNVVVVPEPSSTALLGLGALALGLRRSRK